MTTARRVRDVLTPAEGEATRSALSGAVYSGSSPVLLVGDSITVYAWDSGPACTANVDNGNGTGTISFSSSHNWVAGSRISISNSVSRPLNVFNAPVTAITNSGTFTVTYQLGGRTSPVVSGVASLTATQHMGRHSSIGFAGWLEALRGRPQNYILAAAGGADSTQALTMYNDTLAEASAAHVSDIILMIGTNDVFARAWSFATTQANIKALIDGIRATSPARLWVVMPPPYSSAAAGWSSAKQIVMNRIIRWLWRYAAIAGATPVDSWRGKQNGTTYVNAGATNPDPTAGFNGADGVHPTNLGALAIARSIAEQLEFVQPNPYVLGYQGGHSAVQNQGNAFVNSSLSGTAGTKTAGGGTIVGTAPDSWTVEITSGTGTITLSSPARTVAADGDAQGSNLQVVPSVSATTWRLINTTSLHSSLTAGEVRDIFFPLRIVGAAGLTGIEVVLFGTKSSGGNENLGFVGVSQAITGDLSVCMRVPRWTVPSGLTSLVVFLRFTGATAGTFTIGKPCFELVE
jgi:lysophospholipase L1-like esterase